MKEKNIFASKNTLWITLALLLISCAAAIAVLSGVLFRSVTDADLIIDLIPADEESAVRILKLANDSEYSASVSTLSADDGKAVRLAEELYPGGVQDEHGVIWETDTQVDIFKSSYENDAHEISVAGRNNDKVIAPGTENSYTFSLKNNADGTLDYRMTMNSFFGGIPDDKVIPVEVRVKSRGGWLLGDDTTWEPVLELKKVEDAAVLLPNTSAVYTLEWRWPFESGQDELDTWLGSQTNDITLTIQIITESSYHWPEVPPVLAPIPPMLNGVDHFAYIYGYEDGRVQPEANITRAEVAAIFYRLLKDEYRAKYETEEHTYSDIPEQAWYRTEVATMTNAGILKGYPDGTFRGNDTITRAELAAVLARLSEEKLTIDKKTQFTDIGSHWAKDEIMTIEQFNWIIGYEDSAFRPDNPITRAETVTMINRVLHRLPEKIEDLHKDMYVWPDNSDPEAWYYIAIQEASHTHEYVRMRGTRERWVAVLERPYRQKNYL